MQKVCEKRKPEKNGWFIVIRSDMKIASVYLDDMGNCFVEVKEQNGRLQIVKRKDNKKYVSLCTTYLFYNK